MAVIVSFYVCCNATLSNWRSGNFSLMMINKVALTHVESCFFFLLLDAHVHWWVECVVIFMCSCQEIVASVAEDKPACWLRPQSSMIDGCYSLSSVCSHLTVTNKTQTLMDQLQMKRMQIVNWYLLRWHWLKTQHGLLDAASAPCSFWSSAHHCTCTAVAAAWLISQWCAGSKTRHARDSRALLQPAV